MSKIYYLGSFPPPYGGVTLKNALLYELLKDKVNLSIRQKFTPMSTIKALMFGDQFVLGVGSTKHLLFITVIMAFLRPKAMKKSIVFVMGGDLADLLENKPKMIKHLQRYRRIFVEPLGLLHRLQAMGIQNISLLPNARRKPDMDFYPSVTNATLRCLFFSKITPEKGVNNVLEAAQMLPSIEFDFYGPINAKYQKYFLDRIATIPNANYRGLFRGRNDSLYLKLHEYDLMLLPTKWSGEGVPGALIEAKIAALPAIVSNINYNAEIVEDGVSGIVLEENSAEMLMNVIAGLDKNRERLNRLKHGAKQSAAMYYIEDYIDEIMQQFEL